VGLAGLVAAIVVVGTASATSSVWLREGKPLTEHVELAMTGGEFLEFGSSVLLCETTSTLSTEGGSTATITEYAIAKPTCLGIAGPVEGCEVTAASHGGLPWGVTVNAEDLTAEGFAVSYTFDEACPVHELEASAAELAVTPEEPSEIRLFHFHQELSGKVDGVATTVTDTGVMQLSEGDFGTYGIG
jgi:hypothetical protein